MIRKYGKKLQENDTRPDTAPKGKAKRAMAVLLTASIVFAGAGSFAFAENAGHLSGANNAVNAAASATTSTTTTAAATTIVPDMTFGGTNISLSMAQAVTRMQTVGTEAEAALIKKQADQATATGYKETVSNDSKEGLSKQASDKIAKLRKEFAKAQVEPNYQAAMNKIATKTMQYYYDILQAEENLRVAKDSLTNEKTIYSNTMKKFTLGTAAKIDTLTAQTAVTSAEGDVAEAQTAVANARMSFNILLGYDLMQKVTLTDTLSQIAAPTGTLTQWISQAMKNRNEIVGANFDVQVEQITLESLNLIYPSYSSTYLKQQVAYLESQKTAREEPTLIEQDIRAQSMDLADKARAVTTAKAKLDNAKESYRLAGITYNAGMNTLTDVQDAQIKSYQAGQALNAAIVAYDLAVNKFEKAIGVGTESVSL